MQLGAEVFANSKGGNVATETPRSSSRDVYYQVTTVVL
jgi:hypothetical protein